MQSTTKQKRGLNVSTIINGNDEITIEKTDSYIWISIYSYEEEDLQELLISHETAKLIGHALIIEGENESTQNND